MALADKMVPKEREREEDNNSLSDEQEQDLEIAVLLGKRLIDQGGQEIIDAAMNSSDPAQVIGQFLLQLGSQLGEQLPDELKFDPAIMLASGGWLEQISDFLQDEYDVSMDIMDRAEIYVAQAAQQMAQGKQAQAQQPAAPQPAMPQGVA